VDPIMAIYAPNNSVDADQANITLMTDVLFRCPARSFARAASANGHDVYLYSFEEGTSQHAGELQYVFNYGLFTITTELTPPTPSLVDAVQGYWTHLAQSGDPNSKGRPTWPKYDATADQHMTLVAQPTVGMGLEKTACDFWDEYLAKH